MIYIAGPFFDYNQLSVIKDIEEFLEEKGYEFFSPRIFGVLKDLSASKRKTVAKDVFDKNIEMMLKCTTLLAVIDNFDSGTMIEIGFAFANRKEIITYSPNCYGLNVMLAQMSNGHCITIEEIEKALLKPNEMLKLEAAT